MCRNTVHRGVSMDLVVPPEKRPTVLLPLSLIRRFVVSGVLGPVVVVAAEQLP